MKHVPHLVIGAPWDSQTLGVSALQWRHLTKVMRLNRGDKVTYSDGLGQFGGGRLGTQSVERGEEAFVPRPHDITVAAAPPASKDRQRFLVEKLAELAVARLLWLSTRHGKERIASPAKVFSWVLAATEQSRGAWLMETQAVPVGIDDLGSDLVICHPGGEVTPDAARIIAIGPEGGFADDELPEGVRLWDLGTQVLRVETAAIVAAARLTSG
jgi:16S rRNA U1498 N3-methylase RsmE